MATATKKKTTKTKATKAKAEDTSAADKRAEREARDADLTAQIVELREGGAKWSEIVEQVDASPGKAMFLYEVSQVKPKDRIKYSDDEELAAAIVEAREAGLSWGTIMARANISEGKARGLYEATTGESTRGARVGKGGRRPKGEEAPPKKAAAKTTKSGVKKGGAPTEPGEIKNLLDMNLRELTDRLTGRKIQVGRGGKSVRIGVKEVLGLEDGKVTFSDMKNGGERIIEVKSITKVSK